MNDQMLLRSYRLFNDLSHYRSCFGRPIDTVCDCIQRDKVIRESTTSVYITLEKVRKTDQGEIISIINFYQHSPSLYQRCLIIRLCISQKIDDSV